MYIFPRKSLTYVQKTDAEPDLYRQKKKCECKTRAKSLSCTHMFFMGVHSSLYEPASRPASATRSLFLYIKCAFSKDYVQDKNELIIKYKEQLDLYSKALEQAYNKKVYKRYIYSTCLEEEIKL